MLTQEKKSKIRIGSIVSWADSKIQIGIVLRQLGDPGEYEDLQGYYKVYWFDIKSTLNSPNHMLHVLVQ